MRKTFHFYRLAQKTIIPRIGSQPDGNDATAFFFLLVADSSFTLLPPAFLPRLLPLYRRDGACSTGEILAREFCIAQCSSTFVAREAPRNNAELDRSDPYGNPIRNINWQILVSWIIRYFMRA